MARAEESDSTTSPAASQASRRVPAHHGRLCEVPGNDDTPHRGGPGRSRGALARGLPPPSREGGTGPGRGSWRGGDGGTVLADRSGSPKEAPS